MHRTDWKRQLLILALTLFAGSSALTLTGCNTTEGVGEDIEDAGDAIGDAADDATD